MEKNHKSNSDVSNDKPTTKRGQVNAILQRHNGASIEEMSALANWLPRSTRAFLTGLKKKGHDVSSDKVDGMRRYRIVPSVSQWGR